MKRADLFGKPVYHAEVFIKKQENVYSLIIDLKEQLRPQGEADPEIAKSVGEALRGIVNKLNGR